jgi:hypothetical protein
MKSKRQVQVFWDRIGALGQSSLVNHWKEMVHNFQSAHRNQRRKAVDLSAPLRGVVNLKSTCHMKLNIKMWWRHRRVCKALDGNIQRKLQTKRVNLEVNTSMLKALVMESNFQSPHRNLRRKVWICRLFQILPTKAKSKIDLGNQAKGWRKLKSRSQQPRIANLVFLTTLRSLHMVSLIWIYMMVKLRSRNLVQKVALGTCKGPLQETLPRLWTKISVVLWWASRIFPKTKQHWLTRP